MVLFGHLLEPRDVEGAPGHPSRGHDGVTGAWQGRQCHQNSRRLNMQTLTWVGDISRPCVRRCGPRTHRYDFISCQVPVPSKEQPVGLMLVQRRPSVAPTLGQRRFNVCSFLCVLWEHTAPDRSPSLCLYFFCVRKAYFLAHINYIVLSNV